MLDARYHLFYSIAIFLMLGFGILIGASYYGPVQVGQQRKVVQKLAAETNLVVQQRNQIQGRLDSDEAALAALRPLLVRGRLTGKHVVLVQTGDYADATQAATQSLEEAGATVSATAVLTGHWYAISARQRKSLTAAAGADPLTQNGALFAALASALAHGTTASPAAGTVLGALQRAGLLTLSGDLSQPCALFVVVGGGGSADILDSADSTLDKSLLGGFQALPSAVSVTGCEPSTAVTSSIPAYQAAGISTVDCIDLPLGQIALPFALHGEPGDFGIKPTAKKRLPDTLEGALSL